MEREVVLFDLDGVIIDTELQYSLFWKEIGRKYLDLSDLDQQIKGLTLEVILSTYFKDDEVSRIVSDAIIRYEGKMKYSYIPGFVSFVEDLKKNNVRMGVVTSSNLVKMNNVYSQHPEFKSYFEFVLTSDDYYKSKPDPECFFLGMNLLGASIDNTFIFDIGMMCDFIKMDRFEFLQKYFYITGLQYDITKDLYYADKYKYLKEYYDKMIQIDINKALWQTQLLEYEIKQIQEKRGVK